MARRKNICAGVAQKKGSSTSSLPLQQKGPTAALLCRRDVFVFPTLGDPYGLVVDEAMASSLPVISTSAAGEIADRIVDGENDTSSRRRIVRRC